MTVTFNKLPNTVNDFQAIANMGFDKPERTAALLFCALKIFAEDSAQGIQALNILKGPQPLSKTEEAWFKERLGDKLYLPMAYFNGATPENNYTPTTPYTVSFTSDPRPQDCEAGYLRLYVKTPAFDTPRPIKLRQKGSNWYIWDVNSIMLGVRQPVKDDVWA